MTKTNNSARHVVERFWQLMASNDFASVGAVLSDDFTLDWPLSGERIRGRANFSAMNAEYPAHGVWTFGINQFVADENNSQVVTDVSVSDGAVHARAITFFTVNEACTAITRIIEYWPEPHAPPANRAHLVESL